jgi:hypothetical protein
MQNKHAPLEKLKIIEFKYLGEGLRYWREILAGSVTNGFSVNTLQLLYVPSYLLGLPWSQFLTQEQRWAKFRSS